jgi:DNA-binding MarR family transcriptional regulator
MDSRLDPHQRLDQARALHRLRIGALLRLAQRKAASDAAKALATIGAGPAQIEVLAAVASRPDADQRAIGTALGVDRSTITTLIDAAEDRRWMARSAGADRRRNLLGLTEAGRAMLNRGLKLLGEADAAMLAAAGAQGSALRGLLHRLASPHAILDDAPAALADSASFLLRRLAQAAVASFVETAGEAALPGLDYSILLLLERELAETQTDLLLAISAFRSSTTPALRRLEAGGLIERVAVAGDRRRRHLRATSAGRARLRALDAPIATYEAAFLAPLDERQAAILRDILTRLANAV